MATNRRTHEHLSIYLPQTDAEIVRRAAAIRHLSVAGFLRMICIPAAEKVLREAAVEVTSAQLGEKVGPSTRAQRHS